MLTIMVPLLVATIAALTYGFSSNAKLVELARILFFVGTFWLVYAFEHASVSILSR
jgi:hypothetical protein